jgi:peptide/nickel transport system ATP-binding protein/oligopeptide transport system ATP-binding protein
MVTKESAAGLLAVEGLSVQFRVRRGLFGRGSFKVNAVNNVSFELHRGETLGLVGESGAGKSTVGRALLRLEDVEAGSIRLKGTELAHLKGQMPELRRNLQAVFQDPYSSLNPSMVVGDIIAEPLKIHFDMTAQERKARVAQLMEQVGLRAQQMQRYPSEFSGGQRQRIAIAAALALDPEIIICDEAVSALDVSTQSQVINLLENLQDKLNLAYLFIAHDLAVVRHISDRIGVLYLGHLVEIGPADRICDRPAHPYTKMLLDAVPVTDPIEQKKRKAIRQSAPVLEIPSPTNMPGGCPFSTRCPQVMDVCRSANPESTPAPGGGMVACHLNNE